MQSLISSGILSLEAPSLFELGLPEAAAIWQAKEAELKLRLNKLASLSILPGGYSKHSEAVFTLSEDIVMLLRGGRPSLADSAEKMVEIPTAQ